MTVDHAGLKRVRDWIWTLPPPAYPYPVDRGAGRARRDASTSSSALDCHGDHRFRDGVSVGRPASARSRTSIAIGTDRHRLDSYTPAFAANQYALFPGLAVPVHALPQDARLRQPSARRHLGARARTCTTARCRRCAICWNAPARRPGVVLPRLRRVRSAAASGFVVERAPRPTAAASSATTPTMPGNGNGGHVYGTTLPDDDKARDRRVPEDRSDERGARLYDQRHNHRRPLVPARVWLGIVANLALALPTIAAPDMMLAAHRAAHGDAAALAAVRRPAADPAQRLLHAGGHRLDRYRIVAWLAVGCRGWPACCSSCRSRRTACSGSSTSCSWCRQLLLLLVAIDSATRHRWRRSRRGVEGLMRRGRRRCAGSRLAVACVVVRHRRRPILAYERFFREEPAPYFASDEDHFLFGSIGTEARRRRAVLDLAGAAAHLSRTCCRRPAATRSLGVRSRKDGHEMPIGLSKVTVGFPRVGINCAMCHTASYRLRPGRAADDRRRGRRRTRRRRSSTSASCSRAASDPRFNADTHPRGDREEPPAVAARSAALPLRDHPAHAPRAAASSATPGRLDAQRGPTGAAAGSIRSTR